MRTGAKKKSRGTYEQLDRFKDAAREAGPAVGKDEFARVIGGLAKSKPDEPKMPDQAKND